MDFGEVEPRSGWPDGPQRVVKLVKEIGVGGIEEGQAHIDAKGRPQAVATEPHDQWQCDNG